MENSDPRTKQPDALDWLKKWWPALLLLLLFVWGIFRASLTKPNKTPHRKIIGPTTTKAALAQFYGVDKRTFSKWIVAFCLPTMPDLFGFSSVRKITAKQKRRIIRRLGDPRLFPVLSKKQLIQRCESDYRVLRKSVRFFEQKGIVAPNDFARLSAFPPRVGKQILELMQ